MNKNDAATESSTSGVIDFNNKLIIRYAAATDPGICRTHNEDCFGIQPEHFLFCVADGVGGMDAGEVASQAVIKFLLKINGTHCNGFSSLVARMIGRTKYNIYPLQKQIEQAGRHIFNLSNKLKKKMATTVVVLRSLPDGTAEIGNVGDSRAYLYRRNILRQVSHDHSVANELLQAGISIGKEASFNAAHKITKALGGKIKEVTPDVFKVPLLEQDLFLLCSDGLTDMVSDYDIAKIMKKYQHGSLKTLVQNLIKNAVKAGGKDNITAVLVRIEPKRSSESPAIDLE